jgi:chromosome segregation ATPase
MKHELSVEVWKKPSTISDAITRLPRCASVTVEGETVEDAVVKLAAALTALVAEHGTTDSVAARLSELEDSYKGLAAELGETRQSGKGRADFFPLAKAEWDKLRAECADLRTTSEARGREIGRLEGEAAKAKNAIDALGLQNATLANGLNDAARELAALETKHADTVDLLNAERKAHEHTKRAAEDTIKSERDSHETTRLQLANARKAVEELRTNLTGMRHACERAEKERDEAIDDRDSAQMGYGCRGIDAVRRHPEYVRLNTHVGEVQTRCTELLQETRDLRALNATVAALAVLAEREALLAQVGDLTFGAFVKDLLERRIRLGKAPGES